VKISHVYWKVSLSGISNKYPFDCYSLNLNFTVEWGQIDEVSVNEEVHIIREELLNVWNQPFTELERRTNQSNPQIHYKIKLERSKYATLPIIWPIHSILLVLGSSLLIKPSDLEHRLAIYLSLSVFITGFFFQIERFIPFRIGFTIAEATLLSLFVITGIFTMFSIISYTLKDILKDDYLLLMDMSVSLLGFGILTLFVNIKWFPIEHVVTTIFFLSCGIILRILAIQAKRFMTRLLRGKSGTNFA
jgi:hypothetical protein